MPNVAMQSVPRKLKQKSVFLGLFGVSIGAFALGFDDCLFDLDKVDACVDHAASWLDRFQAVGDHLIQWAIAVVKAALN